MKKIVFAVLALTAFVAPQAFGSKVAVFASATEEDKSCENVGGETETEEKGSEESAVSTENN